ncbi:MAG: NAD(P)/FAD-dependent oxidoreductase, partial [Tepidimonas sp.]|uniref:NAD(P)/FAD-dependent oxidoreductase n=1 Tax=Tepidimonas sp. TaxID=2002775 RepID=UPI00405528B0
MLRPSLLRSDTQLNTDSYYEASVVRPPAQPELAGHRRADVVVVGGGFAGLSAALELAERGRRVVLLEADRVGAGSSGRNGGQAIVGYACGMEPFEAQLGRAAARVIWDLSLQAVRLIDERIARYGIDCDREHGYLYVADSTRKARALWAEMETLARDYALQTSWAEGAAVRDHVNSPRYVAAAYERISGHLHPLKYALGLARAAQAAGATLHEYSPVRRLERTGRGVRAHTDAGVVEADFAVIAGNCTLPEHGPGVLADIHSRIMPVGTYILATAPLPRALAASLIPRRAAVCDNNLVLDYFRLSADDRLLFGGRVSYTTMTPPRLRATMGRRMRAVFPQLANTPISHLWGGFVDITMNRAPDFGRVGDNVYYLQGFSGHGVALAGLAGRLVAEAITAQSEHFDLFARLRHRAFPGGPWLRTPVLALGMAWLR